MRILNKIKTLILFIIGVIIGIYLIKSFGLFLTSIFILIFYFIAKKR